MRTVLVQAIGLGALVFAVGCAKAPATTAKAPRPDTTSTSAPSAAPVVAATASPRIEVLGEMTPNLVRLDKDQEIVVRVRVRGLAQPMKKRPALNLALVVDTSGSMEGQPIEQARDACTKLVDLMGDGDALSIVSFGSRAKVLVPSTRITKESREAAKLALKEMKAEGTTDMAGGLTEGLQQIRRNITPDGIHRVVLVGDGVPNDAPSTLALADSAKHEHIPITTLGLGNDFDETLMTSVAQRASGTFHFVDDASRVATVFKDQITHMERVVARSARIELTPGPGVTITEVVGIPSAQSGTTGQVAQLGDFAEGQTRDVFVRVNAKGRHDGKAIELIDARIVYASTEPQPQATEQSANAFLKINASKEPGRLKDAAVTDVEHGFTTIRVAAGIVRSMELARDGDLPTARKVLETTLRLAKEGEKKFSDKALGEKAIELTKLRKTLPTLVPPAEPMAEAPRKGGMAPVAAKAPPRPAPASAEDAMEMKASHGKAMEALQGAQD